MLKHAIAAIVTIAPLWGALLTVFRILGSFGGISGSKESILFALLQSLSGTLIPFAYGLAIAIVAKLLLRGPDRQQPRPNAGFDIAAQEFANALTNRRAAVAVFDRGQLDSLPAMADAALIIAAVFFLAGASHGAIMAIVLAAGNRFAFQFLDRRHDLLDAEMAAWNAH